MKPSAIIADTQRFLSLLAHPGDVFELRGLARINGQQHVTTGFFDDVGELVRAACERSGKDDGVYVTLNPVNPALLARAQKNTVRRAGGGDTTSDRDVRVRRSILVDVDPVRPTGISSSDEEHDGALALGRRIEADLAAEGWPSPIIADSGNGAHLIYAVDLPVEDAGLVKRVLERLSKRYSSPTLKVDEKVFNPARISKIYGTLTRKGIDAPDRPHRFARILAAPDALAIVSRDVLEKFAPATETARTNGGAKHTPSPDRVTFDVDTFMARNLPDAQERPWASGRKWIVPTCPFNDSHDRGEAHVEQLASGAMSAGCLHESCKWGWRELRKRFEPDAYAYEERRRAQGSQQRLTDREPPPEVVYEDERFASEIRRVEDNDIDAFADRDREPVVAPTEAPAPLPWKFGPELVAAILERAKDPWVSLTLGGDELCRIRAGGTAVVIGGSGSGKSSLVSNMLIEHAVNVGPAIALSIELPAEELGARIVGMKCDASWEDALRGNVPVEDMVRVLNLPRLLVLDRRRATIRNLEKAVDAMRAIFPGQPVLVAIDYAQLLDSNEREARQKVADAFAQIDDCAREKRFVAVALSQMSRASAQRARKGDAIGAESADLGAETAAIERFATVTLSIGMASEREDGTSAVELSIGKWRMGKGDRVLPMTYEGRTGRWRMSGEAKTATEVREKRQTDKDSKETLTLELAIVALVGTSAVPMTKKAIKEGIGGRASSKATAIGRALAKETLVQVMRKPKGARKDDWMIWTKDRALEAGLSLVLNPISGAES